MAIDTPEVCQLREARAFASATLRNLRIDRDEFVRAFVAKAEQEAARLAAEKFGETIHDAYQAFVQAESNLNAKLDELAREGTGCEFELGAKVVRWEHAHYRADHRWELPEKPKRGVIEIITKDSRHPPLRGRFDRRRVEIGDVVVRHLLASGKPSDHYSPIPKLNILRDGEGLKLGKAPARLPSGWFFEGEDANKVDKETADAPAD